MALYDVDTLGLYEIDRKYLLTLIDKFDGGPVGIETLSSALGEERDTLEDVYEPFLVQEGFIQRTPRGRVVTRQACEHLKRPVPDRLALRLPLLENLLGIDQN